MAISHVALKCFDVTAFLNRLSRVKRVPTDPILTNDAVHIMIKVLFKCIPMRGYDPNNLDLRYAHLMSVVLLTRMQQLSPRVHDAFTPDKNLLVRLQLARLLKSQDDELYEAAINMARYIMRYSENIIPESLFEANEQDAYEVIKRQNELDQ